MKGCFNDPRTKVTKHDMVEISMFKKYLKSTQKYGIEKMLKHKFWRTYCNVEAPK